MDIELELDLFSFRLEVLSVCRAPYVRAWHHVSLSQPVLRHGLALQVRARLEIVASAAFALSSLGPLGL